MDSAQAQYNLAITLLQAMLREVLYNGRAHSDPHPGNFAFRRNGQVVIYDYGCVNEIPDHVVDSYIDILWAGFQSVDRSSTFRSI